MLSIKLQPLSFIKTWVCYLFILFLAFHWRSLIRWLNQDKDKKKGNQWMIGLVDIMEEILGNLSKDKNLFLYVEYYIYVCVYIYIY